MASVFVFQIVIKDIRVTINVNTVNQVTRLCESWQSSQITDEVLSLVLVNCSLSGV